MSSNFLFRFASGGGSGKETCFVESHLEQDFVDLQREGLDVHFQFD